MPDFNEARSPLTSEAVQSWARSAFPAPFRALPRATRLKWTSFEDEAFRMSRPVHRSLNRSDQKQHKQLLVIGGYAPGPDVEEEPTDRVVAHVHSGEAEVSFYRIEETAGAADPRDELRPVPSTATVAFHAPFCDVGEDTGGSKAIHRVSALILYYFLAAGHVQELVRPRSDATMFTRNFRDACAWVENRGERPILPPTKRSSGFGPSTAPASPTGIVVRPKRSATIASVLSQQHPESEPEPDLEDTDIAPPLKRSSTDSISVNIKRERADDAFIPLDRPKKHPRRTRSEQIVITKFTEPLKNTILSPRSPAPERVNRALQDRIQHLKDENAGLKESVAGLEDEKADLRKELKTMKTRLTNVEVELASLRERVEGAGKQMKG